MFFFSVFIMHQSIVTLVARIEKIFNHDIYVKESAKWKSICPGGKGQLAYNILIVDRYDEKRWPTNLIKPNKVLVIEMDMFLRQPNGFQPQITKESTFGRDVFNLVFEGYTDEELSQLNILSKVSCLSHLNQNEELFKSRLGKLN